MFLSLAKTNESGSLDLGSIIINTDNVTLIETITQADGSGVTCIHFVDGQQRWVRNKIIEEVSFDNLHVDYVNGGLKCYN